MKKSILSLVALLIATMSYAQTAENPSAQTIETPVCYAYLPIQKFTLKYKFSYYEEKFYTNFRFIQGSDNVFRAGDKIIFRTEEERQITYSVKESQLAEATSGYIPFETSYEELTYMQKGICEISFVRDGKRFIFEPINDKYADTKRTVKNIASASYELEYRKNQNRIENELYKSNWCIQERKKQLMKFGIAPKLYNRIYLGYSPTNGGYDFMNIGYTGGLRLGEQKKVTPYLQFGAQFDWEVATDYKSELSISLPIDISWRCYLGQSNVAVSPFAGAIFRFNPRHSSEDGMLFQPGFEIGANLDYKRFYCGVLYHMEFFTREGLGHTRGLAVRVGCNF
jgi:hypothetical protein